MYWEDLYVRLFQLRNLVYRLANSVTFKHLNCYLVSFEVALIVYQYIVMFNILFTSFNYKYKCYCLVFFIHKPEIDSSNKTGNMLP